MRIVKHLNDMRIENPKSAFVGFFLGYDFTQWFKTLPLERAKTWRRNRGRQDGNALSTLNWNLSLSNMRDGEFDILGMQRFKVRGEGISGWTYVCDCGEFLSGKSYVSKSIRKDGVSQFVTQDEYRILVKVKANGIGAYLIEICAIIMFSKTLYWLTAETQYWTLTSGIHDEEKSVVRGGAKQRKKHGSPKSKPQPGAIKSPLTGNSRLPKR